MSRLYTYIYKEKLESILCPMYLPNHVPCLSCVMYKVIMYSCQFLVSVSYYTCYVIISILLVILVILQLQLSYQGRIMHVILLYQCSLLILIMPLIMSVSNHATSILYLIMCITFARGLC